MLIVVNLSELQLKKVEETHEVLVLVQSKRPVYGFRVQFRDLSRNSLELYALEEQH
jgi:hypothetical protein